LRKYRKNLARDYVFASFNLEFLKKKIKEDERNLEWDYDWYLKALEKKRSIESMMDEDGYSEGEYGVVEYFDLYNVPGVSYGEQALTMQEMELEILKLETRKKEREWIKLKKEFEDAIKRDKNARKITIKSANFDSISDEPQKQFKNLVVYVDIENPVVAIGYGLDFRVYPPYPAEIEKIKKGSEVYLEGYIEKVLKENDHTDFQFSLSKILLISEPPQMPEKDSNNSPSENWEKILKDKEKTKEALIKFSSENKDKKDEFFDPSENTLPAKNDFETDNDIPI
jgi:hypothetical protein